jgi:hypothetical protein
MKRFLGRLLRTVLFLIFIAYFVIAVFVNTGRLELMLDPLDRLDLTRVECLQGGTVCLGTYPEKKTLRTIHPKTVVTLLNPKLPFSRELVEAEKKTFARQGVKVISIPISWFDDDPLEYNNLISLVRSPDIPRPIYVHTYLFDHRLKKLKHRLIMEDKSTERAIGDPAFE